MPGKNSPTVLVDLALEHASHPGPLKSEVEPSDP
jgi:hypothetical protein